MFYIAALVWVLGTKLKEIEKKIDALTEGRDDIDIERRKAECQ